MRFMTPRQLRAMSRGDLRNVMRDPLLLTAAFSPVLIILFIRFALPIVEGLLQTWLGFDLSPYYAFITGFFSFMPPMLLGMVVGFVVLDERDEQILTYIGITPLARSGYLIYRLLLPVAVGFVAALIFIVAAGLVRLGIIATLALALLAAMEAPLMTLFLAAFAGNKVEGLALSKAFGILFAAPVVGHFVHSPWQLLAGISPPYWITKAFTAAVTGSVGFVWYWLAGILVHGVFIAALASRFAPGHAEA